MKFKTIHLYCRFVQYKLKFILFEQPFIIEKLRGFVKIHMKILSIYPLLSYRFIRSILWLISGGGHRYQSIRNLPAKNMQCPLYSKKNVKTSAAKKWQHSVVPCMPCFQPHNRIVRRAAVLVGCESAVCAWLVGPC